MTVPIESLLRNDVRTIVKFLFEECKQCPEINFPHDLHQIDELTYKVQQRFTCRPLKMKLDQIFIPMRGNKIKFISNKDISSLESVTKKEQTIIYLTDGSSLIASKPIGYFETQLPNSAFLRVHRQYIININCIDTFRHIRNEGEIIMKNKHRVKVSRNNKELFLDEFRVASKNKF